MCFMTFISKLTTLEINCFSGLKVYVNSSFVTKKFSHNNINFPRLFPLRYIRCKQHFSSWMKMRATKQQVHVLIYWSKDEKSRNEHLGIGRWHLLVLTMKSIGIDLFETHIWFKRQWIRQLGQVFARNNSFN